MRNYISDVLIPKIAETAIFDDDQDVICYFMMLKDIVISDPDSMHGFAEEIVNMIESFNDGNGCVFIRASTPTTF